MAKSESKKYVAIQSNINITVTPGLHAVDNTRKDSDLPNRLAISPRWQNATVLIMKGLGYYANCIKDWATVKALCKKGLMSIVGESDEIGGIGSAVNKEHAAESAKKTEQAFDKMLKETSDLEAIAKGE